VWYGHNPYYVESRWNGTAREQSTVYWSVTGTGNSSATSVKTSSARYTTATLVIERSQAVNSPRFNAPGWT
jgi:hypothetical protein